MPGRAGKRFDLTKENCLFEEELFKEYRKSFLAEGQLFIFLKRKDYTDIPGALNIENPRKIFCFPLLMMKKNLAT